jgi:hypothetical protein
MYVCVCVCVCVCVYAGAYQKLDTRFCFISILCRLVQCELKKRKK